MFLEGIQVDFVLHQMHPVDVLTFRLALNKNYLLWIHKEPSFYVRSFAVLLALSLIAHPTNNLTASTLESCHINDAAYKKLTS